VHVPGKGDRDGEGGETGTIASAAVDAFTDSSPASFVSSASAFVGPASSAAGRSGGASSSRTVWGPAYAGADPRTTVLGHALRAAIASPAAVLGLAAANARPGKVRAWATIGLGLTYGAIVLPGAVLGCAQCATATVTECALAARDQHAPAHAPRAFARAAATSAAASDTTSSLAAAPSTTAFAGTAAAARFLLMQAFVTGSRLFSACRW
jgi:hypothetical protein